MYGCMEIPWMERTDTSHFDTFDYLTITFRQDIGDCGNIWYTLYFVIVFWKFSFTPGENVFIGFRINSCNIDYRCWQLVCYKEERELLLKSGGLFSQLKNSVMQSKWSGNNTCVIMFLSHNKMVWTWWNSAHIPNGTRSYLRCKESYVAFIAL